MDETHAQFGSLLDGIDEAAWQLPTPCTEWNVADLVAHVTSAAFIYIALLEGTSFEQAMRSGPEQPGSNSHQREAYLDATAQLSSALASSGAMARECDVPGGPIAGVGLATVRIFDVTVHCWDLASALGVSARLPDSIVDHAWGYAVSHYGRDKAAAIETVGGRHRDMAPTLEALILLTGRSP